MNENPDREFNRNFFGILGGVLTAIAAGFLVKLILEKAFHVDPFTMSSISVRSNDPKVEIALGIWLFISSMVGGIACVTISGKNDVSHVIISSLVVLALYFFISGGGILKEWSLASWAILLTIPFGYSIGEWLGSYRKKKKV